MKIDSNKKIYLFLVIFFLSSNICFASFEITLRGDTALRIDTAAADDRFPVRDISYKDEPYTKGYGAYGYVLINNPGKDTSLINNFKKFAEAYYDIILPTDSVPDVLRQEQLVTYWMVNKSKDYKFHSVEDLEDNYSYSKAYKILTKTGRLKEAGPILVAWMVPFEKLNSSYQGQRLIFDLTSFDPKDYARAIRLWRDRLTDVSNWNSIYYGVIKFREEARNLFQQYGQIVVDTITKQKPNKSKTDKKKK